MSWNGKTTEAAAGLDHGQTVIVTARWILIAVGLFLVTVVPSHDVGEVRLQVALILLLGLGNFFLHGLLLKRRAVFGGVAYAASAIDLAVVTILLASQGGDSPVYVLYFPALLALSVAFEPTITALYAAGTAAVYGALAIVQGLDPAIAVTRSLMFVAVAFCGAVYWQVECDRRGRQRPATPSTTNLEGSLR
jgi:hypothetical protein